VISENVYLPYTIPHPTSPLKGEEKRWFIAKNEDPSPTDKGSYESIDQKNPKTKGRDSQHSPLGGAAPTVPAFNFMPDFLHQLNPRGWGLGSRG
jgi:hypothetical protein